MPRSIDTATAQALAGKVVRPVILVDLTINNETLHIWSGLGSFTWSGHTYTGVGDLGTVTPAAEGVDIEANGASLTLSGVNHSDVTAALSDLQLGAPATIWLGVVNSSMALVGQPVILFSGLVDAPSVSVGAEQGSDGEPARATITVPLESRLFTLGSGQQRKYSRADQNLTHSDDTSFNYVSLLSYLSLKWGQ